MAVSILSSASERAPVKLFSLGPMGWAFMTPWALMGQARMGPLWELVGPPWALVGFPWVLAGPPW